MISTWHILISGFTQTLGRPNGTERLWLRLRSLSSPETCVQQFVWDDDWQGHAERIWRLSEPLTCVYVYAYSWGAGWGFITLAQALEKRGMAIAHAVLCDPVYRSRVLPTWLPANPLSLLSAPKIKIPANVHEVTWLRQRVNRPAGHDLVASGKHTRLHPAKELAVGHQWMDEHHEYHIAAMNVAGLQVT